MKLLTVIIVLLITVIAVAFWKDIKNMSARKSSSGKNKLKTVKEVVNVKKNES